MHNSLVGVRTNIIGPSPGDNGGWANMCNRPGKRNVKVFPEPVCEIPITSRPQVIIKLPVRHEVHPTFCIGVGS